jgi:hypothetical protein
VLHELIASPEGAGFGCVKGTIDMAIKRDLITSVAAIALEALLDKIECLRTSAR